MNKLVPMIDPVNFVVHGWDISSMDLGHAMQRAEVLDYSL
jgi:myo-inositol-1-phosphate synthase